MLRLAPTPPSSLLSPSPRASLALRGLHTAVHDRAAVELAVRVALREGTRDGSIANADERAAVASAIFGTSLLRAKLAFLQATMPASHKTSDANDWVTTAHLLALFLLHEEPQRVEAAAMAAALPPAAIGLPPSELEALAALDWTDVQWPSALIARLASTYSLPAGLVRTWTTMLPSPDEAEALCAALSRPGPVTLRTNLAVSPTRASLTASLRAEGIASRAGALSPWAVHLEGGGRQAWGGSIWNVAAWSRGEFEVQDEGSQCVALACDAAAGEQVLDLCAGNGGKTLALAAAVGPEGHVLAHDIILTRLAALRASASRARVGERVTTAAPDDLPAACRTHAPDGHDVVLVDAPCSSSGTLRRHPGLRWSGAWSGESASIGAIAKRRALPALQLQLLRQGASLVRPGGRLVYATCALDRRENEAVAYAFEAACGGSVEPWPFEGAHSHGSDGLKAQREAHSHFRTLWPHRHDGATDGFFIARWRVRSPGPDPQWHGNDSMMNND